MSLWRKAIEEKQRLLLAHRGARSLAPENTLEAAGQAFALGADGWELDVRLSADGVPVVIHDVYLRRTSNVEELFPDDYPWPVDRYEYRTLLELDLGSWFGVTDPFGQIEAGKVSSRELESYGRCVLPTLDQALELTREMDRLVNVEIKNLSGRAGDGVVVEKVVEAILRAGILDRTLISSFNPDYLVQARALLEDEAPDLPLGLIEKRLTQNPAALVRGAGADFYHPRGDVISPAQIRALGRAGIPVLVWTVNDPLEMEPFWEAGAAGVFTDFPQLFNGLQN
jgi:glycerophosphoryl diester phosphodiesterase